MNVAVMSEEQMVGLVRNALLVAGHEMGAKGDHWPAIKSTIHSIAKDWENLKVERNVDNELKMHLYTQLEEMERSVPDCAEEVRSEVRARLKELRELYDAYFTDVTMSVVCDDEVPIHIHRTGIILKTLEDEHV